MQKSKSGQLYLPLSAYEWSLRHLLAQGDTDLFPRLFEFEALKMHWSLVSPILRNLDITNYNWRGCRKFIVPKDQLGFRRATQLDPVDSLVFAAIIRKYGAQIEKQRDPLSERRIFSYRFSPTKDYRFYGENTLWTDFWQESLRRSESETCNFVVVTDISDYYNQIYHHTIEHQLSKTTIPKPILKSINRLLNQVTETVSRGIPIGPHSSHLLAECAANATDTALRARDYSYCRYVDDVHFFCDDETQAYTVLYDYADILDKHQKLVMQRGKTKIYSAVEFIEHARRMLAEQPVIEEEREIIAIVNSHTHGDPYARVKLSSLSKEEKKKLSQKNVSKILNVYMGKDPIPFPRIAYFYRRLSQLNTDAAVEYTIENFSLLLPIAGDTARYLDSCSDVRDDWIRLAPNLISVLEHPAVSKNEYLQMVIINLFAMIPDLNHISKVTSRYKSSPASVQREVIRAAKSANLGDWLKELKDQFGVGDPWFRRALLASIDSFHGDEGRFWLKHIKLQLTPLERLVVAWSLNKKDDGKNFNTL